MRAKLINNMDLGKQAGGREFMLFFSFGESELTKE